ncbi:hypothetical protein [Nonomuraea sp. NEAU-A123]|uniref:hypothetical protein n=1 Tax=Nonomuraea sp. NEAU-A123 TaxID=2839649 RepID=UPI001BE480B0|nr:hypothetical protein [Nonomuraea sp. NEAU-A123]MBT2231576.1 hypothetical protein [Nonomuraea sp. NEAU-A123]
MEYATEPVSSAYVQVGDSPGVCDRGSGRGPCGIAPTVPAGQFSPAIAIRLIDGT